jgi:cardiolipin synthase
VPTEHVLRPTEATTFRWLPTGRETFPVMLRAIEEATVSVRLEMYIYSSEAIGVRFREALVQAAQRGVQVRVMLDAIGSFALSTAFWKSLTDAGGAFQWFNPIKLGRMSYRNHRKLLVCDDRIAIFGGLNIAPEYEGDGVHSGWRDLAIQAEGLLAEELGEAFDGSWALAQTERRALLRFRRTRSRSAASSATWRILLGGPGFGYNFMKRALADDLKAAKSVRIICAYFLPTWRIRRELEQVVRRGGSVELILAGKSDVRLSRLASQRLYRPLLRRGIRIYEYQPQILHAKLFLIDRQVYVGSSNLDTRSLNINYEMLVRITDPSVVEEGGKIFDDALQYSRLIDRRAWRNARTFWTKLMEEWAYFFLSRVDPFLAGVRRPVPRSHRE